MRLQPTNCLLTRSFQSIPPQRELITAKTHSHSFHLAVCLLCWHAAAAVVASSCSEQLSLSLSDRHSATQIDSPPFGFHLLSPPKLHTTRGGIESVFSLTVTESVLLSSSLYSRTFSFSFFLPLVCLVDCTLICYIVISKTTTTTTITDTITTTNSTSSSGKFSSSPSLLLLLLSLFAFAKASSTLLQLNTEHTFHIKHEPSYSRVF